jgi:hypothetical protein
VVPCFPVIPNRKEERKEPKEARIYLKGVAYGGDTNKKQIYKETGK